MTNTMKTLALSTSALIAGASALGATLSVPSGDQILISNFVYTWDASGQPGGSGNLVESDPGNVIQVVSDTNGATFGVAGTADLSAEFTGDTILLLDGPSLSTLPLEAEGHASVNGDMFDYELRVGTGSDLGPMTKTYGAWGIQIDPGVNESIGQPAILRVEATIIGQINAGPSGFSIADRLVTVDGANLILTSSLTLSGVLEINDAATVDVLTTIGSTIPVQAQARLLGEASLDAFSGPAHSSGKITTFDITVTVLIPACEADLNSDGTVDTADLGILISMFATNNPIADINGDGVVDTADLGALIASFGQGCG